MARRESEEEVEPEYQNIVNEIVSGAKPNDREIVAKILMSEKAHNTYGILKKEKVPKGMIYEIMSHGIQDIGKGRSLSASAYAKALGQYLEKLEGYEGVLEDMRKEEVIDDYQYRTILRESQDKQKHAVRKGTSHLEQLVQKAAAVILLISGLMLTMLSGFTISGASVGVSEAPSAIVFVGIIFFIIGLASYNRR